MTKSNMRNIFNGQINPSTFYNLSNFAEKTAKKTVGVLSNQHFDFIKILSEKPET
jgi:hypothetical protein